ncbi:MOSC N-terminal beta barrel domain-containing protein [uncultured Psychrosphaera sp.]|uniref:MOSC domain-containing protein n=1 Tax=uncultured Psychrosphaera sp. TaxID=1403522 RepID=UPI00262C3B6E|nr:MOSC N-terminal beta barrel domain-containing protein [uncultured Psychrosphaera sp.]
MAIGVISELVIYPVKSLQGISLDKSVVTEQGLKWDRHWMIVNDDGLFLTQRTNSALATIQTALTNTHLILKHPEYEDLFIPLESNLADQKLAKVWKSECKVLDEGQTASDWLVQVLGLWREQRLHLVRMNPNFKRQVSVKHTNGNTNSTNFSDGYPFLITNTNSLNELNNELQRQNIPAVPMNRFRSNIIVDKVPAFIEHQSDSLRLFGKHEAQVGIIDFCNPCQRCPVPGIDQFTAEVPTPQQPLKTLFNMQHVPEKGAFFGQNAVLAPSSKNLPTFIVSIGDKVEFVNDNH